jgi:hypothetical protein
MPKDNHSMDLADHSLVLSTLEPGQLVRAKKQRVPRRRLKSSELLILWSLRVYLVFMMLIVVYQIFTAAH